MVVEFQSFHPLKIPSVNVYSSPIPMKTSKKSIRKAKCKTWSRNVSMKKLRHVLIDLSVFQHERTFNLFHSKCSCSTSILFTEKERPVGFVEIGFCNFQFFRLHGKISLRWLKLTFFFTGQTLENQQKHVHGLMHSRALQASLWERPTENPRIRILRTLLQEIFAKKSLYFITFQSNTIALAYLGITGSAKLSTEITLKSCFQ